MRSLLIVLLLIALLLSACAETATPTPENLTTQETPQPQPTTAPSPNRETSQPTTPTTLTLTIPEGYTLVQIAAAAQEAGIATSDEFIEVSQTGNFNEFPLIAAMPRSPERFFALEGYLSPGVYEISPEKTPEAIIRRMLAATEAALDANLRPKIADSGRTIDDVLILASIVQAESLGNDDAKPLVSAVIHNRLRTGMMLQMCKTSWYVRDYIAPLYEGEAQRFHARYNTYMFRGLPVGPIRNPGPSAIRAALAPAQADYFFYIWDEDDNFHFAATWEDHQANVQKYLR
ncbi:MAG: endolytic transglycosylase MltG [Oscillospiraceae bacterium]|nr:endolytic transglycosylase MltG [Oscillospiraceae bacterium]